MWDFSSPVREQIQAPCIGSTDPVIPKIHEVYEVKIIFAIIKNNLFTVLTFALTLHTERWVKLYPDPHQGSGTRLYQLMYSSLPHAPREKITNLT